MSYYNWLRGKFVTKKILMSFHMLISPFYITTLFRTVPFSKNQNSYKSCIIRKATKDPTLVAIVLCIKELTEYLYKQEAVFLLGSREI